MAKILVAEDEPALLESYSEVVTSLGHDCLAAADGDDALDLARKEHPDLVVTDYMMPGRTGVELMLALQGDPVLKGVPVLLISAARPQKSEIALAWRFLSKPINLTQFEALLASGLAASRERGPVDGFVPRPGPGVSPLSLAREDMLSWVAHEIKTPLSAALTGTELAMRGLHASESVEDAESRLVKIRRQLVRMNELVNAVLDAAQLQEGGVDIELAPADLRDLVERAVSYWSDLHGDVVFELGDGPSVEIEADPPRLRQILDNLLSNAVKYGGKGGTVVIDLARTEVSASVSVRDYGRGIPESEIGQIFDRFHRVPGGGGRGHGLGLYIAAALARLHGGEITVQSKVGEGATFVLTLPRRRRETI